MLVAHTRRRKIISLYLGTRLVDTGTGYADFHCGGCRRVPLTVNLNLGEDVLIRTFCLASSAREHIR